MYRWRSERGAVAVEFGLLLPLFLILILCVVEFGRAYNAQVSVTHAAREAARTMAVTGVWSKAEKAARDSAPSLEPALLSLTPTPATCTPGSMMSVAASYDFGFVSGYFGNDITITGKAAMQCGG